MTEETKKTRCAHVDEKGLTTNYKEIKDKEPEITCKLCKEKLTRKEFRERVEYVAKRYEKERREIMERETKKIEEKIKLK